MKPKQKQNRRNQTLKPRWFQILLAISDEVRHGSDIVRAVLEQTDGELRLWPAMLYGTLEDLENAGLIEEVTDPEALPTGVSARRRYFGITQAGKRELAAEARRLEHWVRLARDKNVLSDGRTA